MHELDVDDEQRCKVAEDLAASLLARALAEPTPTERRRRRRIAALVADEQSRNFLLELTDQVLRIRTPRRAAIRLRELIARYPTPAMAGVFDTAALRMASWLALVTPRPVVALATARLRQELAGLVLPSEAPPLRRHLLDRRAAGMRLNVNLLGEAVLGEAQAAERSRLVQELLARPEVDTVSVKLSSLHSQLDVLAYDDSLAAARQRLVPIFEAAASHSPSKLVNLDMEEYRDLHITVDTFTSLLDDAAFFGLEAGIALQAYLPDSADVLRSLCAFARNRVARGGAGIRVRLVKGANLAMERVDAELHGWNQAPYGTKAEVDANYKRLLDIALAPDNADAVRVGVASHNLFDVAWALTRNDESGGDRVEIEMLEGMATPEARAVARVAGGILLYAPVVRRDDFESAVAYLVRRFDENTSPENFLSHLADLSPGSAAWEQQRARFRASVAERHLAAGTPRRTANLVEIAGGAPGVGDPPGPFVNAPDTDFTVSANRAAVLDALEAIGSEGPGPVHAVVDGHAVLEPLSGEAIDPSQPERLFYRYVQADLATVERAVAAARRAAPHWASTDPRERRRILHAVAREMAMQRARTIALMATDTGKVVREADAEVSEAIDGARYYGDQAAELAQRHGNDATWSPLGVIVVTPPWNFPYAIPSGGVLAALAAGNTVILKPAPESVLVASAIVAQCHAAGVPPDVVQFVPCADDDVGTRLVTHPDVDAVILTGAWETARRFLEWRPDLSLHAETSGKNAIVVTAAADQEDAVRDIVHSAFSHAGQKCSAASLAILEAPVYDDPVFLERLADAVASLRVGPAADLATKVGPLIRPPKGPLLRALTSLGPTERWLVEPRNVGGNPHLWSPGVKMGVRPGSEFHLTECFGPVLGVLRARDLAHAIALQNATPYGLTGGICSLDDEEVATWQERVAVGNAYVNRHITGAIIRRQPFGGWKRSSIGPGAKAGGPNYVATLGRWQRRTPVDVGRERSAARADTAALVGGVDPSDLRAERNVFRLRPLRDAVIRLGGKVDPEALDVSLGVAADLGVHVELSGASADAAPGRALVVESEAAFIARVTGARPSRVRLAGAPEKTRLALLDAGLEVDAEPILALGRYELLRWTREQAVSTTMHRHGNVLDHARPTPQSP